MSGQSLHDRIELAAEQLEAQNYHSSARLVRGIYQNMVDYRDSLHSPPAGWFTFGTFANPRFDGLLRLEFWGDLAGLPLWERPIQAIPRKEPA